jgi:transcription initiation factor TFIID subunit TAF12
LNDYSEEVIEDWLKAAARNMAHRGGDSIKVEDLALHLERQCGIRFSEFEKELRRTAAGRKPAQGQSSEGTPVKEPSQGTPLPKSTGKSSQNNQGGGQSGS